MIDTALIANGIADMMKFIAFVADANLSFILDSALYFVRLFIA